MTSPEEPLAGVRVVDALGGLAGGYCTKLLCDAGAEVVLLEPAGGDALRRWRAGSDEPDDEGGALFAHLRGGQRAALDTGPDSVAAWASTADCVILGFDGPDPRPLLDHDPGLVVVSITPYGRLGPDAHRPATAFTLQADVGGLTIRGRPDRPPYHAGGRVTTWFSAAMAATAALAGLRRARRTGVGGLVDLSMAECANLATTNYASIIAELLGPEGDKLPPAVAETPAVEPTADGYVVFTTNTAQQFSDFCVLIGRPELIERYTSATDRQRDWDRWNEIVHDYTRSRTTEEIVASASALRIPVAPVCTGRTVVDVEHFVQRGVFRRDPTDRFSAPRRPWSLDGASPPAPRAAPGPAPADGPDDRSPRRTAPGRAGLPLDGVRVLDATAWWAGPVAGWVLAGLGAEVIHVESARRPDGMRMVGGRFARKPQWWDRSWFFLGANANKESLTLDLSTEVGRSLFLDVAAGVDVVVENYTPRVFEQFDLTPDVLHAVNPALVVTRMPAFGLDGPWRDRPGFAQTMESLSGLAWITGHPDDQPRLQGGPCDPNAGVHAAFAVLAALERRDRTGEGCTVEVPMVESALNIAAEQVVEYSAHGTELERGGNRGPFAAPQGLYAAIDGWLAVAVADDHQWASLAATIESLAPWRAASVAERRAAHDAIDAELARWAALRAAGEAAAELAAAGVPAALARDPRHGPDHPQFVARGFYERIEHPVVGEHRVPGLPFRLTGIDRWIRSAAPTLGRDNDRLLRSVGVDDETRRRLADDGIIGDRI